MKRKKISNLRELRHEKQHLREQIKRKEADIVESYEQIQNNVGRIVWSYVNPLKNKTAKDVVEMALPLAASVIGNKPTNVLLKTGRFIAVNYGAKLLGKLITKKGETNKE